MAFPPRSRSHQCLSSPDGCAFAPSSAPSPTISASGPAGRPSNSSVGLIDPPVFPRLWRSPRRDPRSQPRRGPGWPETSPAPGRLGAGWARNFFLPFPRVACAATPFPRPRVSPATWSHPCVSAPTAAAGVSADPAPTIVPPSTGPTSAPTAASIITTVCACGAGPVTSVASVAHSCSSTRPCISGSSITAGPVARCEAESPPEAAAVSAANSPSTSHPVAAPPDVAASAASVTTFICPTRSSPSAVSGGDLVIEYPPAPRDRPVRVLATHLSRGSSGSGPAAPLGFVGRLSPCRMGTSRRAARWARGDVSVSFGNALGAGSLRRLALAALQSPRDIVPAAASVLRWMDGRLCWILAE
ncbi:unnamed protein product [Closterium sp. NIES-53]